MAKKDLNNDKKKNNFSKELKAEMKKVTWPSFKQLVTSTSGVISIVLIVAIIVFILDICFENINKLGVEQLKSVVSSDVEESIEENEENVTSDEEGTSEVDDSVTIEPEVTINDENTTEETDEAQLEQDLTEEVAQ